MGQQNICNRRCSGWCLGPQQVLRLLHLVLRHHQFWICRGSHLVASHDWLHGVPFGTIIVSNFWLVLSWCWVWAWFLNTVLVCIEGQSQSIPSRGVQTLFFHCGSIQLSMMCSLLPPGALSHMFASSSPFLNPGQSGYFTKFWNIYAHLLHF